MQPTDILAFVKFNQGTICVVQSLVHHEQSYMMCRFLFILQWYDISISTRKEADKTLHSLSRKKHTRINNLINRVVRKNLASAVIAMPQRWTGRQKLKQPSEIDVASLIWRDCRCSPVCQNNYVISLRVADTLGKLRRQL